MRKCMVRICACLLIAAGFWGMGVLRDREILNRELVRLHVVANSNGKWDQDVKLQVRDAVLESLWEGLDQLTDVEAAKEYIRESLPKIERAANRTLEALGVDQQAAVSFCKENFDIREYDTFTLPGGIYDSLRVIIGEGEGHNWWCVAFPSLCRPATTAEFDAKAAGAGFSEPLREALEEENPVRFWLLDALGRLECRMRK